MNAAAAEPRLGDRERLSLAAEDVIGGHTNVGVAHVAVGGVRGGLPADSHVADDLDAGGLGRHDE